MSSCTILGVCSVKGGMAGGSCIGLQASSICKCKGTSVLRKHGCTWYTALLIAWLVVVKRLAACATICSIYSACGFYELAHHAMSTFKLMCLRWSAATYQKHDLYVLARHACQFCIGGVGRDFNILPIAALSLSISRTIDTLNNLLVVGGGAGNL